MTELTHETARELASAWFDGELGGHDADALQSHFAGCASCASYAEALGELAPLLRRLPRIESSPDLVAATIERVTDVSSPRWQRRATWLAMRLTAVVATAVVLAVLAGLMLRPGTPVIPFAPLPATAGVAQLSAIESLYVERTIVSTPRGDEADHVTVEERTWWVAPDRLRVDRIERRTGGTSTSSVIRRGSDEYAVVDGRESRSTVPPGPGGVPEPLSAGIAVLGHPVGPGPTVAGRSTTRYELEIEGVRRVALVDVERYAVLGGEERAVLTKEAMAGGGVIETRTTRALKVNEPIDDSIFAIPSHTTPRPGGFTGAEPDALGIVPPAAPEGLTLVASGVESTGRETLTYQRGAFQLLVTSYLPIQSGPGEELGVLIAGRPAVLRLPLYGLPSITFTRDGMAVTVSALLPRAELLQLAEDMYFPAE